MEDKFRLTDKQQEMIDCFIDDFDFEKVANYMENTNWRWAFGRENRMLIPGICDIKQFVRRLIKSAYENMYNYKKNDPNYDKPASISSGGFFVQVFPDDDLEVLFAIADYTSY